jgi:hypothetical protein
MEHRAPRSGAPAIPADDGIVRFIAFILSVGLLAGVAPGQTTRASSAAQAAPEVPLGWEKEVTSFAAAVAAKDDQAIQTLAGADCQIRKFGSDHDIDISELTDFASSTTVLGNHAYIFPSTGAAGDIADDVNSSAIISSYAKRSLDLDGKRDQTVVMQWMTTALTAQDGMFVGIVVMWDTRPDTDDRHRPNFILMTAEKSGDAFKLKRIVFGDPLQ